MKDAGPRAIAVGYPEKVHVVFDANIVRLAQVWRGRFFDASGVASGRTDEFKGPLGEDIINLPAGPAFAILKDQNSPWPQPAPTARNVGGDFKGYRLNQAGQPAFRYLLGKVEIEEMPTPLAKPGGAILKRSFVLRHPGAFSGQLYFLAGEGKEIQPKGQGIFKIDSSLRIELKTEANSVPLIRIGAGRKELLVPVKFQNGQAKIEATLTW
jgi:hypothetical protein